MPAEFEQRGRFVLDSVEQCKSDLLSDVTTCTCTGLRSWRQTGWNRHKLRPAQPCSTAIPETICSHCLSHSLFQSRNTHDRALGIGVQPLHHRSYHSLMNSPATTAADAPGLANLQGLLHVYKQSLDSVGSAVEQLRHTLVPEVAILHEEDAGRFACTLCAVSVNRACCQQCKASGDTRRVAAQQTAFC